MRFEVTPTCARLCADSEGEGSVLGDEGMAGEAQRCDNALPDNGDLATALEDDRQAIEAGVHLGMRRSPPMHMHPGAIEYSQGGTATCTPRRL
jgi:hypothetical protein